MSCTMAENGGMDRHSNRLHLCAILYYFVFKILFTYGFLPIKVSTLGAF